MKNHFSNTRLNYIDGYKGIACFCIMIGHFCGIYKYSSNPEYINNVLFKILTNFPLSIFTSENFWLSFFIFSSGYLCTKSALTKIKTFRNCIVISVVRILRLAIPVFFSGILILLLQKIFGFYNEELESIINNTWFSSGYNTPLSILDVITNPFKTLFLGFSDFVPPYWCLREILFGTLLVYISIYFSSRFSVKYCPILYIIIIFFICCLMVVFIKPLIIVVLIGSCFAYYETYVEKMVLRNYCYIFMALVPILAFFLKINSLVNGICFGISLYGIKHSQFFSKILSNPFNLFFGKISWGIFSYHWPIFCSFGSYVLICLFSRLDNWIVFMISLVGSILFTIVISCFDNILFSPLLNKLLKCVKSKFLSI